MGRKACPNSAEDRTEDIKKYASLAYNRAVVLSKQNQRNNEGRERCTQPQGSAVIALRQGAKRLVLAAIRLPF